MGLLDGYVQRCKWRLGLDRVCTCIGIEYGGCWGSTNRSSSTACFDTKRLRGAKVETDLGVSGKRDSLSIF